MLDFISTEFPEYVSVFQNFPYKIQRFDPFRYLAVYRLGGFYFDLDILLSKALDLPLENLSVFRLRNHVKQVLAREARYDLGSRKLCLWGVSRRPFSSCVIENCVRSQQDQTWIKPMMVGIPRWFRADFEVLNSTGPGMLSRTLAESGELRNKVTILFPEDHSDRTTWHQFGLFGVHLMEGSWRDQGSFLRRKLAWRWEAWARKKAERSNKPSNGAYGNALFVAIRPILT